MNPWNFPHRINERREKALKVMDQQKERYIRERETASRLSNTEKVEKLDKKLGWLAQVRENTVKNMEQK